MTDEEIKSAVQCAIEKLKSETPCLNFEINERATAHRLAVHLENLFTDWNVDCEYNRDLEAIKLIAETSQTGRSSIDIVVHRRGQRGRQNNLLAIEIKKKDSDDIADQAKLVGLTSRSHQYQYQFGLYIKSVIDGRFDPTWYKDGEKQPRADSIGDTIV